MNLVNLTQTYSKMFYTYFPRPVSSLHCSLSSQQFLAHWILCWPEIWFCIHPMSLDLAGESRNSQFENRKWSTSLFRQKWTWLCATLCDFVHVHVLLPSPSRVHRHGSCSCSPSWPPGSAPPSSPWSSAASPSRWHFYPCWNQLFTRVNLKREISETQLQLLNISAVVTIHVLLGENINKLLPVPPGLGVLLELLHVPPQEHLLMEVLVEVAVQLHLHPFRWSGGRISFSSLLDAGFSFKADMLAVRAWTSTAWRRTQRSRDAAMMFLHHSILQTAMIVCGRTNFKKECVSELQEVTTNSVKVKTT